MENVCSDVNTMYDEVGKPFVSTSRLCRERLKCVPRHAVNTNARNHVRTDSTYSENGSGTRPCNHGGSICSAHDDPPRSLAETIIAREVRDRKYLYEYFQDTTRAMWKLENAVKIVIDPSIHSRGSI